MKLLLAIVWLGALSTVACLAQDYYAGDIKFYGHRGSSNTGLQGGYITSFLKNGEPTKGDYTLSITNKEVRLSLDHRKVQLTAGQQAELLAGYIVTISSDVKIQFFKSEDSKRAELVFYSRNGWLSEIQPLFTLDAK